MKKTVVLKKRLMWVLMLISLSVTASINAQEMISLDDQPEVLQTPAFKAPLNAHVLQMSAVDGDVTGDATINVADVTALIKYVLEGQYIPAGDLDHNGITNVADVTALIQRVLNGPSASELYNSLMASLKDVYTSMRKAGWSTTGNTHQCFGIMAYSLAAEVMGDDMIMGAQGSGWFWFDAAYSVKSRYTSAAWRSYDFWNAYYTWIGNANYLLSAASGLTGDEYKYVCGQAYAIRAYSYFMLAQWFARTFEGHQDDPCVPFYDGVNFKGCTGQPRATVAEVYAQIDNDIDEAVRLLNGTTQLSTDHIGYAVALGLRARIALVEEDWNMAYNSASNAISASGKSVLNVSDFKGMNDATAANVMWGAQIPADDVGMYASLWTHMMTGYAYGQRAPKQISKWLYNKMSATDTRRAWWTENNTGVGSDALVQAKFSVKEGTEWEGDYIYMRVEEMYLTAAEAACRLGRTSAAKNNLNAVMSKRVSGYSCNKTGTSLGAMTHDETGSLLEEIILQRRIELWGEDGRILTIRRLRQGFERTAEDGWPTQLLLPGRCLNDPESCPWVMTIPLAEFNNYYSRLILNADQNPIGDTYEAPEDVERAPQHLTFDVPEYNITVSATGTEELTVRVKRPNTSSKPYYALLRLQEDSYYSLQWYYVYFGPNQYISSVTIPFNGKTMPLGQYTYTLSLTDLEMSVANSSQRTSTKIVVDVANFGAEGQHISFATANQNVTLNEEDYVVDVPVTLTRAVTSNDYRAVVTLSDASNPYDIYLASQYVFFNAGESTAKATVRFNDVKFGNTYSCVLTLSDEDIATANPSLGEQITSTTVTLEVKSDWEPAGTCTFFDYVWTDGSYADDIPVERRIGTNDYRIIDPLCAIYGNANGTNFEFHLNGDGSITVPDGYWTLDYWGYQCYYNATDYGDYCYIEQEGNTYDVHHLLKNGDNTYWGHFKFTWNR